MEESQRGNDKGKSKVSGGYKLWTLEESNELLQLMVDAANHGWRDSNGMLSKQKVEKKILPALNAKLGCERNHSQYLSRLKWFKQRYNIFSELMRHSSGFGWDPITKKFTASDEVWKDYIKCHPAHVNFQTDTFADYELLRIAIGNGTAIGRNSIALGDDTDARTLGVEESRRVGIDDLSYDYDNHAFIPNEVEATTFQDLSPKHSKIYVLSGWEGSAHDSKVLNDDLSRRNGLKVPQDFAGQGRDPENATELFNLHHASLRNVIERIFGIFKSRFTIFKSAPLFPYRTQAELVLACAGLHNFLRRECRSDEFPIELENESSSSSPLPGNEGDNVEQVFETQEQQRENANEWIVGIASDMWRNAMQDNNGTQR
ncbi:hypothetical protein L3X38_016300 [Prunus dulcis]|uniref:Myb/SANT-like domain-containing protein n=1 Tax=Prunus dulcis TaxID=3755 RepID=A0AAD4W5P1_PRUDU|nr:hypothetical protein L3X38_016300 [Prunus dulcis]